MWKKWGATMSYDISFKVKVEGIDEYVEVGDVGANITWNVKGMICRSTGLEWKNAANNGLCKDVMVSIAKGYAELTAFPKKYKQYESPNGWGTVKDTASFFNRILESWQGFCLWHSEELVNVVTFWVE